MDKNNGNECKLTDRIVCLEKTAIALRKKLNECASKDAVSVAHELDEIELLIDAELAAYWS